MDFRLTPEQESLRDEAKEFAESVVAPGAAIRDRDHLYPEDIMRAATELGYLGLLIPEKWGGNGRGNLAQAIILEEIARCDASAHVTISVHNSLVTAPIVKWGTDALRSAILPDMARGALIGAYALTEPEAGSDAASLKCQADRDGSDWVLTGSKIWITTGARADVMIVFARTNREVSKAKGISAFLVPTDLPGFTTGKRENKLGIQSSETVSVFLEGVRVPDTHLLGEVDRGFNIAMQVLNGGRIGIATQSVGIARAALELCVRTIGKRDDAGRRATQDETFRLAEMAAELDAARLLTWRAARMRDEDVEHIREASVAKLFASQSCNRACRETLGIIGPEAWNDDGEAARLFRDARITELYEGTTEVQKLVISKVLLGR